MLAWINKKISRIDFFAAHCYGRIKSCVPLAIFYGFDSISKGTIKAYSKLLLGGRLPAIISFLSYLIALINKAKETHDSHCDSIDLKLVHKKLAFTTDTIRKELMSNPDEAKRFLKNANLADEEINKILDAKINNADLNFYPIFQKVFSAINPHQHSHFDSILGGVLHGISHFNEYALLKYFADLDLLAFKEGEISVNNLIGIIIVLAGAYSFFQSIGFSRLPKKACSDQLLSGIPEAFHLFTHKRKNEKALTSVEFQLSELDCHHNLQMLKDLASINSAQKCYLNCN